MLTDTIRLSQSRASTLHTVPDKIISNKKLAILASDKLMQALFQVENL